MLLLADGADDVSVENDEENDGNENAEDNDVDVGDENNIDVGDGNNGEVCASRLQRCQLT